MSLRPRPILREHVSISSTIVPETHVKIHQHKNVGEYIGFIDLGSMTYKFRKKKLFNKNQS